MRISLNEIETILKEAQLIKEYVTPKGWYYNLPNESQNICLFTKLSYDSRQGDAQTLFFCKGLNFKEDFLKQATHQGVKVYVSEQPYDVQADLGVIVTNVRQAMALISMAFYDYPQDKMTLIGYTGTKGKTTAAYFTKSILNHTTNNQTAMLSTMNSTLNGIDYFKSTLTTPESLDLYRMMSEAVDNGMSHFIMEVSSQAYKVERVFGLQFDVGIFMNISPDHISPIEHPTFDDYYYCKRQLIRHSKQMIIHSECQDSQLLLELASSHDVPVITYSESNHESDYYWAPIPNKPLSFSVGSELDTLKITGNYHINLMGDFNKDNALAAIISSSLTGASREDSVTGLNEARIPGRMEQLRHPNGATILVDYAHNKVSLTSLLRFAKDAQPEGRVITVIGSPGDKAQSRRADFANVLSDYSDVAILTEDDPGYENPEAISNEIASGIHNDSVHVQIITNRQEAIEWALRHCRPNDTVIIAGKGRDMYQKIKGVDEPYQGDYEITELFLRESF